MKPLPTLPRLRLSMTWQFALLAVLPALLAMTAALLMLTRNYLSSVEALALSHAHNAALQTAAMAQAPVAAQDRRALLRIVQSGSSQPAVLRLQIWSAEGELLAQSAPHTGAPAPADADSLHASAEIVNDSGQREGQVVIEFARTEVRQARRRAWLNLLLALAAGLLGIVMVGAWGARRVGAPVRQLARAMGSLASGQSTRVALSGAREVQQLQQGFNQAAVTIANHRSELEQRVHEATTALARKNQQIEQASAAKMRLLAAASHDLRQPLHALTLFSESLASSEPDTVRRQRIGHMRECVASLDRLFSELLDITRIDAGALQPQWAVFPLDTVFDEISRNFRPITEAQNLRLVVRHTDIWVHADYGILLRILSNLVSNAVRHTLAGGVLVAARRRGALVRIDVVDSGVGIAPEHQQRVFEEFVQLEQPTGKASGGMGLGLATVRRLVDLLHAQVRLTSRVGCGTCVQVLVRQALPQAQPHEAPPDAPALTSAADPHAARPLEGWGILVIDDDAMILEGLSLLLSEWGARVMCAATRAQALAWAERWPAPPDAVLTDYRLGNGELGPEILQALSQAPYHMGRRTARIVITGETLPERLAAIRASGVEVLCKPVPPSVLRSTIVQQVTLARAWA